MRAQLLKTVGEFRATLTPEASRKPDLKPTLTSAFALLDKLSAERTSAGKAAAKRKANEGADAAPADADG